uniref:CBFA2/RUNX1 partner transcriptional co-repressor 2 n=1 Tax=Rousettus aegyptiacus TaxID=9407 RepID=A0A7J8DF91_ROUAE|nr:CBFA2/RUNX1 partner transcriptional co-repressor 2 [Rousettus aegyptiacus]
MPGSPVEVKIQSRSSPPTMPPLPPINPGGPRPVSFTPTALSNGTNHSPPTLNGAPSPPQRFSNGPASSTSSALTNQQLPATCGARQLSKLKRFLTTLQQFGNDISPEIGEKVRTLVLALVRHFKDPQLDHKGDTVGICRNPCAFLYSLSLMIGHTELTTIPAMKM